LAAWRGLVVLLYQRRNDEYESDDREAHYAVRF
jgi:hypothetical protein